MPNYVTNQLEILDTSKVAEIFTKYSTVVERHPSRNFANLIICVDKNTDEFIGTFCDKEQKFYLGRDNKNSLDSIPENVVYRYIEEYLIFPDFAKVIPPLEDAPAYRDKPSQEVARSSPNWWYTWNKKKLGDKVE